jgi:hypothetical protein
MTEQPASNAADIEDTTRSRKLPDNCQAPTGDMSHDMLRDTLVVLLIGNGIEVVRASGRLADTGHSKISTSIYPWMLKSYSSTVKTGAIIP